MATRMTAAIAGVALLGGAACNTAMADDLFGLFNPLGLYVGAGLGRTDLNQTQFDYYRDDYNRLDGSPLGWNAVIGIRPIPFVGAEAEYIDFGNSHPHEYSGNQFFRADSHDRAAGAFAVGYLPIPLPFLEPFAKVGWAQIWEHNDVGGVSYTNHPSGVAYGGGVQFHFQQLGIRAQYERISGSHTDTGWNDPSLLSIGVNWTF